MELISNISNSEIQKSTIVLQDGREFNITLEFKKNQIGWFLSLEYGSFKIDNVRLVTSRNMLYQWRNVLNFGLAVVTDRNQEPMFVDDLTSGRCRLYALSRQETVDYARYISGQISA